LHKYKEYKTSKREKDTKGCSMTLSSNILKVLVVLALAYACEGQAPQPQCATVGAELCWCGWYNYCQSFGCCYSAPGDADGQCCLGGTCHQCPDNVYFCCSPGTDIICECGSYYNFEWVTDFNNATTAYNQGQLTQDDLVSTWKQLVHQHASLAGSPVPAGPASSSSDYALSAGDLAGIILGSFFGGLLVTAVGVALIAAIVLLVFKYRSQRSEVVGNSYISMNTDDL